MQHARHSRLEALVAIRDDQLDTAQAAPGEAAQEVGPEGLGLAGAAGHAEHLATAIGVDRDRDGRRNRDDAPGLAHFDVGRVQPA